MLESESVPPKVDPAIAVFNFVIRLLLSSLLKEIGVVGPETVFVAAPSVSVKSAVAVKGAVDPLAAFEFAAAGAIVETVIPLKFEPVKTKLLQLPTVPNSLSTYVW